MNQSVRYLTNANLVEKSRDVRSLAVCSGEFLFFLSPYVIFYKKKLANVNKKL